MEHESTSLCSACFVCSESLLNPSTNAYLVCRQNLAAARQASCSHRFDHIRSTDTIEDIASDIGKNVLFFREHTCVPWLLTHVSRTPQNIAEVTLPSGIRARAHARWERGEAQERWEQRKGGGKPRLAGIGLTVRRSQLALPPEANMSQRMTVNQMVVGCGEARPKTERRRR